MKKWFKKHFEFELLTPYRECFTLADIYFEKYIFGYALQFVVFGFGFYVRYNTKKSLRHFAKMEKKWENILGSQEAFDKHTEKLKNK